MARAKDQRAFHGQGFTTSRKSLHHHSTATLMAMNPRLLRPTAGGLDPDALAWRSAVIAAGSSVDGGVVNAVSRFVKGCKADGIWDAMKSVVILAGADTLAGALAPLKGTAPTSYNFVSGDYSATSGLVGNGSTKYLNSNRAGNADPQDSYHQAIYSTNNGTVGTTNAAFGMYIKNGTNENSVSYIGRLSAQFYTTSRNSSAIAAGSESTGFFAASRAGASTYDFRFGGASSSKSAASNGSPTTATYVFAAPSSGGVGSHHDCRLSFYSIGEAVDLALLDARVSALMTDLGVS